jgi:mono/diheme cytochrome c family protein
VVREAVRRRGVTTWFDNLNEFMLLCILGSRRPLDSRQLPLPCLSCLLGLWLALSWTSGATRATEKDGLDFNRDIRPILSENCFYCHGQDGQQREAGLRLDDREEAVLYGAITPGEPDASELIARIEHSDPDLRMPPVDSNRKLSEEQRAKLRAWIKDGAPYEAHWAFVTPERPRLPEVQQTEWVRQPLDQFVLSKLEAAGLEPAPEADRATLIRRLFIDLLGLPPTPEEIAEFEADEDPSAYERLVDRLLQHPHYGERMTLSWLDAARYADSNGFQQDGDTWQWIWRDWVVQALNRDLPFDQFTTWQLAGDLLPEATTEQKIASAFNRNHLLNGEGGAIPEEQRFVNLFDRVDTTSTTWLGLTVACAQCHDHKYDPITQREYYQLLDAFNRVPERGTPQYFSPRIRVAPPFLELPNEANRARIAKWEEEIAGVRPEVDLITSAAFEGWKAALLGAAPDVTVPGLDSKVLEQLQQSANDGDDQDEETKRSLEEGLRKHFDEKLRPELRAKFPALGKLERLERDLASYRADQIPRVMIMSDDQPRETAVLDRGEYLQPTEPVSFDTPAFLPTLPEEASRDRLGLAEWLVSEEHPLTSRVRVNRLWQHFFGEGLVQTSEDFGVQSEYPVHRELLDWLAVEFREQGWSQKQIQRMILTSATYRQSSRLSEVHREEDPRNRLLSRASRFRMPSMILRDWALATAGILIRDIHGAPVYPYQPSEVWEALAITKERDFTYPQSSGRDLYRRSLYTFWRRTVQPANMFDSANRQACTVRLASTSTPLHALTTLNDPTWVEAARLLAQDCLQQADTWDERLESAFFRVVCRPPRTEELEILRRALENQLDVYRVEPEQAEELLDVGESPRDERLASVEHAALTAVCLGILNLDEALTRQ